MKRFWIVFFCLAIVVGAGLVWMARVIDRLDPDAGGRNRDSATAGILRWQVAGAYPEERETDALAVVMEGDRVRLRDVIFALTRAARDSRITGLLLDIRALPAGWAQVEELRDAVAAFARTGKPVVAWLAEGGEKEYAFAMAAPRIVMPPEGSLFILGVSAELSFLKGTLDKLGMSADFVHVGRYKSAPEQLTRDAASAPNREMIEAIVDDHYSRLVAGIAAGRRADAATVRGWIDAGMFDATAALAAGLVDTVLTLDDLEEAEFPDEEFVDLEDYALGRRRGGTAGTVALIQVNGTIMPGESGSDAWSGRRAGSDTIVERLRQAREDDAVQAVLLRVDSPGGSALASDLIWREVARVHDRKPVIVSMGDYAASGGYYVACGADSIFAEPGTLTGSIGVFAGKVAMSGLYSKLGITREFVTRGENALLFSDSAPFTDAQRASLQATLGAFYVRFLAKVAQGRRLPEAEVAALAEGRVWTGAQAQARGLVDGLGGLTRALDAAKRMIGVNADELVTLVSYEEEPGLLERMLARMLRRSTVRLDAGLAAVLPLPPAGGLLAAAPLLDGRPLALLPLRIDFR
jgi:protease-4